MTVQPKHINLLTLPPQTLAWNGSGLVTIKSFFLFCLFLTISFCSTGVFAQYTYELDKTTRFEHMSAEEGLSTALAMCMHQDKYGFIWIGTQLGLNLYDGYEVKVFHADPKNSKSIYNDYIFSIYEEPDGTMWFCTVRGISKYNRANQTFTNYIPDTLDLYNTRNGISKIVQDGDYLWGNAESDLFRFNKETGEFKSFAKDSLNPSKGIYGTNSNYIFIDRSGVLWVSSYDAGGDFVLSRFNKETGTFSHYQNDPSNPESFPGKRVASMIEDKDGTIWFATWYGGLHEIVDKETGKFRHYVYDENDRHSVLDNDLFKVFEDSRGNIWTGGKDGFSKLDKKTRQFINYQIPPFSHDYVSSNFITDITESYNGDLWLEAYAGFFRFDPSTLILRHYLHDPENKNSLSNDRVFQIIHDRSGHDWILTAHDGVNKLNHFSNSFHKVERNSYDKNPLSGNSIFWVFGDSRGNLWLGTDGLGLNKTLLNKTKKFTDFELYLIDPKNPKSISGNRIFSITEDKEQTIWIGTLRGLSRYNAQNNDFTRFIHDPNDPTSINNGLVVEIAFEDSYGVFWVGTRSGLDIIDRKTGKFLHFLPNKNKPGSIANSDIREIFEDSYGDLWFAGEYLEKLNRKDTSFVNYLSDPILFQNSDKKDIWNIVEDDSANLWMTTDRSGIFKFQRNDSTFVSITTEQGLPSNNITVIEIDNNGFIWAGTTQGLSRIDPCNYSIRNYDDADGLVNLEFNPRSSFKDEDGWLYFGGRNGVTLFHPDSLQENKFVPPVYITSFAVAGQQKYFDKPLYEMSTIELQHNENDFSFDFVALNYINSQKNQYAYMLEGYDEDWQYVGKRRTAYYTNLSPGNYTFRVKGSNNDGYWNEEGASLAMVIYPPFWKTWWAYVVYALTLIVLVYIWRRNELRRINLRQELELKQVQADQLVELDIEKNKFFSNISHEFRTPLTLILGPLERLIGSPKDENQKEQLTMIRRNARRLQMLINQLLSLSKLESGKMKLKTRSENIVKLTRMFLQSFHSMAEDKGIKLEFETDAEEYIVCVDTGKFEKIVNNLLSNAFKFTERGGFIKVAISSPQSAVSSPQSGNRVLTAGCQLPTGDCLQIKFSDTGRGIKKEDLPHVFDRFYQVDEKQMRTNLGTGIGLALTKELVELHHGTITAESEPGMGTTFTVLLPRGKDHLSEDEISESANSGSEKEDELINDDYLFAEDIATKTDKKAEETVNDNLPLLLIVEDNEDMRSHIKSYLTGSFNIIEATNGREGAEKAIEHIPDLIVSDLMMPKLDGNEMTLMLKTDERTSHIPIILLTAKASKESKMEGLETGADDFLTKPFDADELLVRVNNLINQRKRLREIFGKKLSFAVSPGPAELKDSGITSMDEQFMKKAYETAEREMANPEFDVSAFSKQMGLSRMQLHRKLTALTNQSATEFIKVIRLNKAAVLLKSKSATAAEIGYDVGFNTPAYFSTCFKEHFGKSPSEYANQ